MRTVVTGHTVEFHYGIVLQNRQPVMQIMKIKTIINIDLNSNPVEIILPHKTIPSLTGQKIVYE